MLNRLRAGWGRSSGAQANLGGGDGHSVCVPDRDISGGEAPEGPEPAEAAGDEVAEDDGVQPALPATGSATHRVVSTSVSIWKWNDVPALYLVRGDGSPPPARPGEEDIAETTAADDEHDRSPAATGAGDDGQDPARDPDLEAISVMLTYVEPPAASLTCAPFRRPSSPDPPPVAGKAAPPGNEHDGWLVGNAVEAIRLWLQRLASATAASLSRAVNAAPVLSYRAPADVRRVVVVGVHGWLFFHSNIPVLRFADGELPTLKFCLLARLAVERALVALGASAEAIEFALIPLEGHGRIATRVDAFYDFLTSSAAHARALADADLVVFATHSQGAPTSVFLLDRLLGLAPRDPQASLVVPAGGGSGGRSPKEGRKRGGDRVGDPTEPPRYPAMLDTTRQRVGILSMAGLHHGTSYKPAWPIRFGLSYTSSNTKELFAMRTPNAVITRLYRASCLRVLRARVRMVCVASLRDAVVDVYSAGLDGVNSPNLLRALYAPSLADSPKVDFVGELMAFALRVRNRGIASDLARLMEPFVAGTSFGAHSEIHSCAHVFELGAEWVLAGVGTTSAERAEAARPVPAAAQSSVLVGVGSAGRRWRDHDEAVARSVVEGVPDFIAPARGAGDDVVLEGLGPNPTRPGGGVGEWPAGGGEGTARVSPGDQGVRLADRLMAALRRVGSARLRGGGGGGGGGGRRRSSGGGGGGNGRDSGGPSTGRASSSSTDGSAEARVDIHLSGIHDALSQLCGNPLLVAECADLMARFDRWIPVGERDRRLAHVCELVFARQRAQVRLAAAL